MRLVLPALLLSLLSLSVEAKDFSWRLPHGSRASLSLPSPKVVERYVRRTWGLEEDEMHVCSAALVDVAKDGYYRLVASVDPSGRDFCNEVIVMRRPDRDLHTQTFSVWQVEDIAEALVDLDHDGIPELLLPQSLSAYQGAETCGTWTRIYRWKDDNYVNASDAFPDFYEARYHLLKSTLENAEHPECLTKEMDKIEEFLKAQDNEVPAAN
ncbi:MAG: hypothetical protein U1E36_06920 [Rickettsiales bacterium]